MTRVRPAHALVLVLAALALHAPAAAPAAERPPVSASAAIVMETSTGDVAYSRRAGESRPIASVTKLMTALLTLERSKLSDRVAAVRYPAAAVESQIGLRAGERLTTSDMLRGLLLASANDAAAALAESVGGSRRAFVRDMNRRAKALGLADTRFADPIGLDPRSRSSARDLVRLTMQLRRFEFFKRTVNRSSATLESGSRPRTIANRNTLVRQFPWVSGVKTGHTARAGYVLVGSASRNGVTLVSVVLGAASETARNADTVALLRYGFSRYVRRRAVRRGEVLRRVPIRFRRGAEVSLVASRTVRRVVRRGTRPRVGRIEAPAEVEGPIRKGQRLGSAEVLVRRDRVAIVSLVAAAAVPAAGVTQRTKDYVTRPVGFALALALAIGTVGLVLRRRSSRTRPPDRPRDRRTEVEAA